MNRNIGLIGALDVFVASDKLSALTITEPNPDHGEPENVTLDRFASPLVEALAGRVG